MGLDSPVSVCLPFRGDSIGGSLVSSIYLIKTLQKCEKLKVIVPVGELGEGARMLIANGLTVQIWPELAAMRYRGSLFHRCSNLVRSVVWARRRIAKEKLRVVHTNNATDHIVWSIACRLAGCHHIWHQRTRLSDSRMTLLGLVCTRQILCISQYVRSTLPKFVTQKSDLLVNPIDVSARKNPPHQRRPHRTPIEAPRRPEIQKILVGFAGAFNRQKRVLDVIEIARALKEEGKYYFLIMGKNGDFSRDFIQELVSENDLSHLMTIWPFIDNPRKLFEFCDIVIAPSEEEASGRVILEAFDAGAIVVASKSGGHPEIVRDGRTGFLVELGSVHQFAEAILKYSDRSVDINSMRVRAHEFVCSAHSLKQFGSSLAMIYQRALNMLREV